MKYSKGTLYLMEYLGNTQTRDLVLKDTVECEIQGKHTFL